MTPSCHLWATPQGPRSHNANPLSFILRNEALRGPLRTEYMNSYISPFVSLLLLVSLLPFPLTRLHLLNPLSTSFE